MNNKIKKKKKIGFSLVELLVVVVVLAIIALIATPIVLNVIKDSKKSSTSRSAEMYLDAVTNSIASAKLKDTYFNTSGTFVIKDDDSAEEFINARLADVGETGVTVERFKA